MSAFTICNCGFGAGFYHTSPDGTHEYNPDADIPRATHKLNSVRKPLGQFYGHIDGKNVIAMTTTADGWLHSKTFKYNEGGKPIAFFEASEWIKQKHRQQSLL